MAETLNGTVERVVFYNADNGFTVLELDNGQTLETVVGTLPEIHPGEQLVLEGSWVEHKTFGRQFQAESCHPYLPDTAEQILRYLSSGAVKGVGIATAAAIVRKFGENTLTIMEKEPERLCEIRGITKVRAEKIGREFAAQFGLREVMMAFSSYGLTAAEALRCWRRFGSQTADIIRQNPYRLCDPGLRIAFERADTICAGLSRPVDDPARLRAGLLHVLRHNLYNGHTCLPEAKLTATAAAMLGVEEAAVVSELEAAVQALAVYRVEMHERSFIFLPELYQAEAYAAARLKAISTDRMIPQNTILSQIDALERQYGITYEKQQREAIRLALEKGLLLLTGGPGTGKTTTLRAIIRLLEGRGETVAVTAPTGRAAKRMSELTGCEAKTLHRLLEAQMTDGETSVFMRNEDDPLDADALVVDEMSMVDSLLFESMLRALKPSARLILVGDSDQLPAVGPGSVMADLIASGCVPTVRLTEVFRQALQSKIITNAHRIVTGAPVEYDNKSGDFFLMSKADAEQTAETVVELCSRRLPSSYDYTVWNGIQVLCPGRKGPLGTIELNARLQEKLNPPARGRAEMTVEGVCLRVGDKVMHNRNNYDIVWVRDTGEIGTGVFNGDIGVLEAIDKREETLSVRYDDRVAQYSKQEAQDLELAYAVTVHKSQGSGATRSLVKS